MGGVAKGVTGAFTTAAIPVGVATLTHWANTASSKNKGSIFLNWANNALISGFWAPLWLTANATGAP